MGRPRTKGKYTCYVWTPELKQWLIDNTKGLKRPEAWELFCKTFPDIQTTFVAFNNQRSRLKCAEYTCKHGSTKMKPLYAEKMKKDYIFVKVALPSTWWSKAKWVWCETHPGEYDSVCETDCFYFLDGDNRNFDPNNIERVHRREQAVFQGCGGVVNGNPEQTKLNILQARLKLAQLDALETVPGQVVKTGGGRLIVSERNEKMREARKRKYYGDPEWRRKYLDGRAAYMKKKMQDPEFREKKNIYAREWARKNRSKK